MKASIHKLKLFIITCLIGSASGCIENVASTNDPHINITYTEHNSVRFNASLSNASTHNILWEFGDGYQGSGNNISHRYLSPGTYQGKLHYQVKEQSIEKTFQVEIKGDKQNIQIHSVKTIAIDSDHNDPNQPSQSNNIEPQKITSPITISGILMNAHSCQAGRLCNSGDMLDSYQVQLINNENITITPVKGAINIAVINSSDLTIYSKSNIHSEHIVNGSLFPPGQYQLHFTMAENINSAQYIVNIDPPYMPQEKNYQPGKLIVIWENSNKPELVDISDPRIAELIHIDQQMTLSQARHSLQNQKNIKSVSLNYYRQPFNQSYWHWPLITQDIESLWQPLRLRGQPPGDNVTIAVLDTGIFFQHDNFTGLNHHSGYDFVSDPINAGDHNGWDSDPSDPGDQTLSYHGSHVAGIIAAQTNQSSPDYFLKGLAWGTSLMPLRVLGINGGTSYDLIHALRYAAGLPNDSHLLPDSPADIINLSLGGTQFSIAEKITIDEVINSGAIVVAAAGNQGQEQVNYPAAYNNVIAVGALDINGNVPPYSNTGSFIDVVAPGGFCQNSLCSQGILGVTANGNLRDDLDQRQSSWKSMAGTSMASAHVSALLAIARSYLPALDAFEVNRLLQKQMINQDILATGFDQISGWGMLNSNKILDLMDTSPLDDASLWLNKMDSYTHKNSFLTIDITTRGEIAMEMLKLEFNEDQISAEIKNKTLIIKTSDAFSQTQQINIKFNNKTIRSLRVHPNDSHHLTQYSPHLYLSLNSLGINSSGLRTVTNENSWEAQVPPLKQGQIVQVSSDIDYDGIHCEPGEFCGLSESLDEGSDIGIIINGSIIEP